MKVIARDNFDRELPGKSDEWLVASEVPENKLAEQIAALLNAATRDNDSWYYVAVEDSYVLKKYEP